MTPGPWTIAPNPVCVIGHSESAEQGIGMIAMCGSGTRSLAEAIDNARAIAALPQLLSAAILVICDFGILVNQRRTLRDLADAIAQATGSPPPLPGPASPGPSESA